MNDDGEPSEPTSADAGGSQPGSSTSPGPPPPPYPWPAQNPKKQRSTAAIASMVAGAVVLVGATFIGGTLLVVDMANDGSDASPESDATSSESRERPAPEPSSALPATPEPENGLTLGYDCGNPEGALVVLTYLGNGDWEIYDSGSGTQVQTGKKVWSVEALDMLMAESGCTNANS